MEVGNIAGLVALFTIIGAALAFLANSWGYIKGFFTSCFRFIVNQIIINDENTAQAVLAYMINNYKIDPFSKRTFGGKQENLRNGKFGLISYELLGENSILFWNGWIPVWYGMNFIKSDEKVITWGKMKAEKSFSLSFFRGSINVEELIKKASENRNSLFWETNLRRRFFIKKVPDPKESMAIDYSVGQKLEWFYEGTYRLLSHKPEELGKATLAISGGSTDKLYFPPAVKELISEVKIWINAKDWYKKRHIPWKRGWVLYGPPGTGKSILVRSLAEDLDLPLFVFSLGRMLNSDLEKSWIEMQMYTPCIALFEDFDNVFSGRENVYGKPTIADAINSNSISNVSNINNSDVSLNIGRLTFDCLLNCLDGVDKTDGIFTIITTNYIDKLDGALGGKLNSEDNLIGSRPGRIDKIIELTYMLNEDKISMARRIFFDDDKSFEIMKQDILKNPDRRETPAQFQERCAQFALKLLWTNQELKNVLSKEKNIV